ncbi:Uncharacterized protein LW93_1216 [Fusarium fujikuroi]|nr:Uncharacterized protein LW93_1216 [Fusarium fujikuroi]
MRFRELGLSKWQGRFPEFGGKQLRHVKIGILGHPLTREPPNLTDRPTRCSQDVLPTVLFEQCKANEFHLVFLEFRILTKNQMVQSPSYPSSFFPFLYFPTPTPTLILTVVGGFLNSTDVLDRCRGIPARHAIRGKSELKVVWGFDRCRASAASRITFPVAPGPRQRQTQNRGSGADELASFCCYWDWWPSWYCYRGNCRVSGSKLRPPVRLMTVGEGKLCAGWESGIGFGSP